MSHIVAQDFDSEAFGVPFYRIVEWEGAGLEDELSVLQKQRPVVIDAKAAAEDLERNAFLQRHKFRNVCTQLELRHHLMGAEKPNHAVEITDGLALSGEVIARHARNFTADRFALDPQLAKAGHDRLYEKWIANSLAGRASVAWHQTDFCSFTEQGSQATIDLLSVLNRRQGVGRSLVLALLAHARAHRMTSVRVVTEAANRAAWQLYLGCGFTLVQITNCYHFVAL
jgi:GNAT superfamily N-acetyltransferase